MTPEQNPTSLNDAERWGWLKASLDEMRHDHEELAADVQSLVQTNGRLERRIVVLETWQKLSLGALSFVGLTVTAVIIKAVLGAVVH